MKFITKHKLALLSLLILALLIVPIAPANAAGGSITGTVTDPKGAVVANAKVTAVPTGGGAAGTTQTDKQGKFKIDNLAPGPYLVTITAAGFVEINQESVTVEEGKAAQFSRQLEIAPVTAGVNVDVSGVKPNRDPLYQRLRQGSNAPDSFSGEYATVTNLVLQRDAGTFTLRSGELYFLAPVDGRTVGAVFIGDGEFHLVPPTAREKSSLAIFTDGPEITEAFTQLVLRFTDETLDEVKKSSSAKMGNSGPQAAKARDLFRDKETLLRKELRANLDLRILTDLYAPPRPGFFLAFINGKKFSKLAYHVDPFGLPEVYPEQVELSSYGDGDGGIWTAFHLADEYRKGTATSAQDRRVYDISRHEVDTVIQGTKLTATDRITYSPRLPGQRIIPFDLFGSLRVSRVQDESGRDLEFIQQAKDEDADFGVILPEAGEVGKPYKLTVEYSGGDALADAGSGNYFLIPRSTWYPNNPSTSFGDRATFDLTFHYPKGNVLVGVGNPTEPARQEGNSMTSHWTSGEIELQVAGFNYGRLKKKEEADPDSGFNVEYFYNEELPDSLKMLQFQQQRADEAGQTNASTLGAMTTSGMAQSAIADTKNATRIYNAYFGKIPFTRIAMTQQPAANFGQAWPSLIYMPFTAFLDDTTRVQLFGIRGGTNSFWTYVGPHEISHQWWGHAVGWSSYHDQWMSEGFAEFSTSLYAQYVKRDIGKFNAMWDAQRALITQATPNSRNRKPYTVGPVTQGYRLNTAKTGGIARVMIYPKGAYILHMLRMLMQDARGSDGKFIEMMKEFVQTHLNQDASTEDFQRMVEKHMTPSMDVDKNKSMNWFFAEWVYGTEMPSYKFDYQVVTGANGKPALTGTVTQSGVSKDFVMMVPIYIDYGKGYGKLGSVILSGNTTYQLPMIPLDYPLKRATLCAMSDVLYSDLEVNKH